MPAPAICHSSPAGSTHLLGVLASQPKSESACIRPLMGPLIFDHPGLIWKYLLIPGQALQTCSFNSWSAVLQVWIQVLTCWLLSLSSWSGMPKILSNVVAHLPAWLYPVAAAAPVFSLAKSDFAMPMISAL